MKRFARPVAVLACSAAMFSPMALTSSASATSSAVVNLSAHSLTTACKISAVDRAALLDQLAQVRSQLRGTRPSPADITALHAAVAELRTAALDANMSAAVRTAKLAQLVQLTAALKTATSVTDRVAIRAQRAAIRAELQAARLIPAQRAAIQAEASALRAALWGRPTAAQAKLLRAEAVTLEAQLHCRAALTSAPPVAGS
jgi:hypothetical protein